MILLVASLSPSSLAGATSAAHVGPQTVIAIESGTSDAHEGPAFLDLRTAHVRVKGQTVSVRLTTYEKWRTGWLLQCRDATLIVSWPDDQLQVDIDKRQGQQFRAVIRKTDTQLVVGRVPARHVDPRTVTFSFSAGKLQSSTGKWKAFSASPNDSSCKLNWYFDDIPDDGYIVP
jgi:hypothetical protein